MTTIRLINSTPGAQKVVLFMSNEAGGSDFAIAWRVINLGASPYTETLNVPLDYQVQAGDSFGNATALQEAKGGERWNVVKPVALQRDSSPAAARDIEVVNKLTIGAIDASLYKDGKPVAMKSGLAAEQRAIFRIKPVLYIALAPNVEEGTLFRPVDMAPVEIPLDQGELTVVLSGGGQKPFEFHVYPITGNHVVVLERDGWEYVERKKGKEAVAIIAITDDRKAIFVEQYRRPVDARVIDWPAGLVGDDGENDPEKTARKELEEETGYTCAGVELLAKGPTSPGITSEIVSFYRAQSVTKKGDHEQEITVHLVPLDGIRDWLGSRGDVMIDLKVWGGLYFVT